MLAIFNKITNLLNKSFESGHTLVTIYLVLTTLIFIGSFTCSGLCGFGLILPIMPWNFIVEFIGFPIPVDFLGFFFIAVALNSFILYWFGSLLDSWFDI